MDGIRTAIRLTKRNLLLLFYEARGAVGEWPKLERATKLFWSLKCIEIEEEYFLGTGLTTLHLTPGRARRIVALSIVTELKAYQEEGMQLSTMMSQLKSTQAPKLILSTPSQIRAVHGKTFSAWSMQLTHARVFLLSLFFVCFQMNFQTAPMSSLCSRLCFVCAGHHKHTTTHRISFNAYINFKLSTCHD